MGGYGFKPGKVTDHMGESRNFGFCNIKGADVPDKTMQVN